MGDLVKIKLLDLIVNEVQNYNLDSYVTQKYKDYIIDKITSMDELVIEFDSSYEHNHEKERKEKIDLLRVKSKDDISILDLKYCDEKICDLFFSELYFIDVKSYHFRKFKEAIFNKFSKSIKIDSLLAVGFTCNVEYTIVDSVGSICYKGHRAYVHSSVESFTDKALTRWLKELYFTFYIYYGNNFSILDKLSDDAIKFSIMADYTTVKIIKITNK